jgi:hypothetical protein
MARLGRERSSGGDSLSLCGTGADSFSRGQSCPIFGATRGSDRESVAHFDRPLENDFEHFW